jgi:hypothetical protein
LLINRFGEVHVTGCDLRFTVCIRSELLKESLLLLFGLAFLALDRFDALNNVLCGLFIWLVLHKFLAVENCLLA